MLEWPQGAQLRVTATTATTATLTWPAALGDVRTYTLNIEGRTAKSTTSLSATVEGLAPGQHLAASVVALSDTAMTRSLSAEVAAATVLVVPPGDVSVTSAPRMPS